VLFTLRNAPASAQGFLTKETLSQDHGLTLNVCECTGCGLIQLTNEPVDYYQEVIRSVAYSAEMKAFRQKQFLNFVESHGLKGRKILEIGSGKGEFLQLMNDTGAFAFGIEGSADSAHQAQQKGLSVSHLFLGNDSTHIENGPFDSFFIMSYLEHIPEPGILLTALRKNLKENAPGIVEVPNFDMILQERQFSEFTTDHLYYFTETTLRRCLELQGFDVIEIKPVWHNYILSAVVKKRSNLNLSAMHETLESLISQLDSFISNSKRPAVWGAGHQALTLLSLIKKISSIDSVIDSAPFKQGKFTPVSHKEVISPDEIQARGITDIIVMAGSFNHEICEAIKTNFGNSVRIGLVEHTSLRILTT
jgi:SAM-dependent methyltransferase